jgi:beta-lactamase superfamily II metal-dependent hydrolase
MIFSLEALRARHGDSLILHFGDAEQPGLIVIDGGPSGVYKDALRPRLDQLRDRLTPGAALPIAIVMVSHIDDDHIRGLLDLTAAVLEEKSARSVPVDVRTLWHNAFDDFLGNDAQELVAAIAGAPARVASGDEAVTWEGAAQAIVASVSQGRDLRDNARKLAWKPNQPFKRFVMAPSDANPVQIGPLRLTVLCPRRAQLEALQKEWAEKLRALKHARKSTEIAEISEYLDKSVYNLSSIVCLAEVDDKRMLLTGDARGDQILEGFAAAGLLEEGKIELDILKLPHHGSDRNVDEDFFHRVRARHYIASGDGEHHNPEVNTLRMISAARPDDDFELHLTYENCKDGVGEELAAFFKAERDDGRRYKVSFRRDDQLSLQVDLLGKVAY